MFEIWSNSNNKSRNKDLMTFVVSYFNLEDDKIIEKHLKLLISRFISNISIRWTKCNRTKNVFLDTYSDWLDGDFKIS